jgi:lipopolysaccharide export system permease protein
MILERYLTRRLAVSFVMVSGIFLSMLLLLDMVEQMRRLAGRSIGFEQIVRLSALNLPEGFYEIAPLVLMLSAMWVGLGWSRSSEFVVIRATGRSVPRLIVAPTLVVLVAGMGFVAVMNPLVASASREYTRLLAEVRDRPTDIGALSAQGLWLRQADLQGQTVIHAQRAEATGTILHDVTFLVFPAAGGVTARLSAERAVLHPGMWHLEGVKLWDIAALNPEQAAEFPGQMNMATDLTPERIRDSFAQVRAIPLLQLPGFIANLERAGFAALEHRMRLNMELALPVMLAGLMVLSLALSIHHMRAGSAGVRALITILAGFALFFLRNFAQVLGESGQIPVSLAAWGLPVATLLMALGVMLNLEER